MVTDAEVFGFTATMKRLGSFAGKRVDTEDFRAVTLTYFRALKRCQLGDLERAADVWIEHETRFPKPVEWRGSIPKRVVTVRVLSTHEAQEYDQADRLGFEDRRPCGCLECAQAGMSSAPESALRYVPLEDEDGHVERGKHPDGRIVVPGRWIHGGELRRWYLARANFWANAYATLGIRGAQQQKLKRLPFEKRIEQIFSKVGSMTGVTAGDD